MNLFSMGLDKIHLGNHVRLFEAFSGIGTQAMALKRLGVNVEHIGFSEIDKYAIQSYLAIHGDVKNYGDITKMSKIPPCDIFTWSFPCTDLSKAGKQKGLNGTRSGLGFEVIRLLEATKDKPKVLLMENVPDLLSPKFRDGWQEIYNEIESLGYTNYVEVLNAKNYGVAQNRDRVFMVSILGEYAYEFPKPIELTKRLKDYLEDEVDEKYYLSDKTISRISNWKAQQDPFETMERTNETGIVPTLTARGAGEEHSGMVLIKEATKQGYAVAQDGDGVYINRPHQKRGVVQNGMIQTLKTSGDDVGVVVNDTRNLKEKLADDLIQSGTVKGGAIRNRPDVSGVNRPNIELRKDDVSNALATFDKDNVIAVGEHRRDEGIRTFADDVIGTLRAKESGGDKIVINNQQLRIRKLTPLECWRLMGINDQDFYKAQSVVSNSQLYKQAGNSIVVDVLVEIFRGLL